MEKKHHWIPCPFLFTREIKTCRVHRQNIVELFLKRKHPSGVAHIESKHFHSYEAFVEWIVNRGSLLKLPLSLRHVRQCSTRGSITHPLIVTSPNLAHEFAIRKIQSIPMHEQKFPIVWIANRRVVPLERVESMYRATTGTNFKYLTRERRSLQR